MSVDGAMGDVRTFLIASVLSALEIWRARINCKRIENIIRREI